MEAAGSTLRAYHMAGAGISQGGSIKEPEEPMSDGSVWASQVAHLGRWLGGRAQVWLSSRDRAELGAWCSSPSKEARTGHRPLLSSLGSQVPV